MAALDLPGGKLDHKDSYFPGSTAGDQYLTQSYGSVEVKESKLCAFGFAQCMGG